MNPSKALHASPIKYLQQDTLQRHTSTQLPDLTSKRETASIILFWTLRFVDEDPQQILNVQVKVSQQQITHNSMLLRIHQGSDVMPWPDPWWGCKAEHPLRSSLNHTCSNLSRFVKSVTKLQWFAKVTSVQLAKCFNYMSSWLTANERARHISSLEWYWQAFYIYAVLICALFLPPELKKHKVDWRKRTPHDLIRICLSIQCEFNTCEPSPVHRAYDLHSFWRQGSKFPQAHNRLLWCLRFECSCSGKIAQTSQLWNEGS